MGWETYKKTVKHNFKEFGCPDFWVELKRLDAQPYGEGTDVISLLDEKTRAKLEAFVAGGLDEDDAIKLAVEDPETARVVVEISEKQLAENIVNWNLTHPKTNDDLPVPTDDDTSSFQALPREFVAQMHKWLREDSELAQRIPKKTRT